VRLGVTAARISEIERGNYASSVDSIERLAKALGVKIADLFDETGSLTLPEERAPRKSESARLPRANSKK
jgi:transcriptional regulator with XRE-family HTH domain